MKTYGLGKPCICLICCTVFNRIDSHKAHKHHNGSTEHYIQAINDFKRRTEKILFAKNYFPKGKKHNLKDKLKKNKHENEHDDVIMKLKTHHPSTSHFKLKRPLSSHTQSTHTQSKVPSTSKAPYQTHPKATSLSSDTSSSSYISHTQSRAPLSS